MTPEERIAAVKLALAVLDENRIEPLGIEPLEVRRRLALAVGGLSLDIGAAYSTIARLQHDVAYHATRAAKAYAFGRDHEAARRGKP